MFLCNILVLAFKGPTVATNRSKMEWRRGGDMPNLKNVLRGIEIKEIKVLMMLADGLHEISSSQT